MKNSITLRFFCMLLLVGIGISTLGYALGGKSSVYINNAGIHLANDEITTLRVDEQLQFSELFMDMGIIDVNIISGDRFYIDATYRKNDEIRYSLDNGKLSITMLSSDDWLNFNVGFGYFNNAQSNKITVCIPKNTNLSKLAADSSIGDLSISGIQTDNLTASSSTGSLTLKNIKTDSIYGKTSIGDMHISDVEARRWDISSDTGGIDVRNARGEQTKFHANIGDIRLTNWYSEGSEIKSNTGSVVITGSLLGENVIDSDIGDVRITLNERKALYRTDFKTDIGNIKISPSGIAEVPTSEKIPHSLEIHTDVGSIDVTFAQ